jgi:hypothetical protein
MAMSSLEEADVCMRIMDQLAHNPNPNPKLYDNLAWGCAWFVWRFLTFNDILYTDIEACLMASAMLSVKASCYKRDVTFTSRGLVS